MVVVIKVILRKYVQITEPTYGRRHARSAYERSTDRNYISSTLRRYGALRVNDGGDPPSGTKTTALAGYVIGSDECRPIYGARPIIPCRCTAIVFETSSARAVSKIEMSDA